MFFVLWSVFQTRAVRNGPGPNVGRKPAPNRLKLKYRFEFPYDFGGDRCLVLSQCACGQNRIKTGSRSPIRGTEALLRSLNYPSPGSLKRPSSSGPKPAGPGDREHYCDPKVITPTSYHYNHENVVFREPEIIDLGGLDGLGGPRNHSKRQGA